MVEKQQAALFYKEPGPFLHTWKDRLRFALVTLLLIPASEWVSKNVLIEPASTWYLDLQLRRLDKEQEHFTRIVRIDPEDYTRIFRGQSPLSGVAIAETVCAIAKHGPAVVVVDLDTSSESSFPPGFDSKSISIPVVWAVDTTSSVDSDGRLVQQPDPVLGGRLAEQPPYGIARMPQDFDGLIRRWKKEEQVAGHSRPTLPWAAVQEYCRPPRSCENSSLHEASTTFTRDVRFQEIRLSELLPKPTGRIPASCKPDTVDPRLAGRIVVLGGFYSRDDRHETSWGTRRGAELVAMAIEHVFRPAPLHKMATTAKWSLKILLALLIAYIHHRLRPLAATAATVLLLPVAVVILGEVLFQFGSFEVGVVAFAVGILIDQLITAAERAEHLAQRIETENVH